MSDTYRLNTKSARIILKQISEPGLLAIPVTGATETTMPSDTPINAVFPGELVYNIYDGVFSTVDQAGNLVVFATNSLTLGGLSDVNVSGATDNQVLTYDAISNTWIPEDGALGLYLPINFVGDNSINLDTYDITIDGVSQGDTTYNFDYGSSIRGLLVLNTTDITGDDWLVNGSDIKNSFVSRTSDNAYDARLETSINGNSTAAKALMSVKTPNGGTNSIRIHSYNGVHGNFGMMNISNGDVDPSQRFIQYGDGGGNPVDYSLNWSGSTTDAALATKGYVDRATSGSTGGDYLKLDGTSEMDIDASIIFDNPSTNNSKLYIENGGIYKEWVNPPSSGDTTDIANGFGIYSTARLAFAANYLEATVILDIDPITIRQTLYVPDTTFETGDWIKINGMSTEANPTDYLGLDSNGYMRKVGTPTVSVSNGLTDNAGTVELGGTLIKDTTIDTSTYYNMSTKDDSKGGYLDDAFFVLETGAFPLSFFGVDNIWGTVNGDGTTTNLSQNINFTAQTGPNKTIVNSNNIVLVDANDEALITNSVTSNGFMNLMNITNDAAAIGVFELNPNPDANAISIREDRFIISNGLESDLTQKGIHYSDDATNYDDYSIGWDATTDDAILATKGYVDRATSGSTPSGATKVYNQFPTGFDNNAFYDDGILEFTWDAPSNRPKIKMLTQPSGTGGMRSLAIRSDGTSQNTFITTPNFTYSLFTSGVSAGDKVKITIAAEQDPTFPFYDVTIYNLGNSYNTSFIIEKIN